MKTWTLNGTCSYAICLQVSPVHYVLFWVSVIMFQLEETMLYEQAICLLDSCLRTLDAHNVFNYEVRIYLLAYFYNFTPFLFY